MSGDEVRVNPDDLRAKAAQIEAISWGNNPAEVPTVPADALDTAQTAVDNLNANATSLADYQDYGKKQGQRLAETLRLVADAYATVDQNAMDNINNTVPGATPAVPAPVTPGANTVPAPTAPPPMPTPQGMASEGYLEVKMAQGALLNGDQAASLDAAADTWAQNGATLATAAQGFELSSVNWEGEAADAAYRSFHDYQAFLIELSGAWNRLASEAQRVAAAHFHALGSHTPVAQEYAQLESQLPAAIANGGSAARVIQLRMEELQRESEELRHQYAREGQPDAVNPPEPPQNTGSPPIPVRSNGDPRRTSGTSGQQEPGSGESQPGSGAAGGQPQPAPQSMPPDVPRSPAPGAEQAAQGSPEGGAQGGQQGGAPPGSGQQPGGSPAGGSPGGGQPGGGGMPGGAKGDPKFPTYPSVRPAAAGGGGGGSAGGGGGGVPGSPLQPAVGAETVAPTPVVAPVVPAAAAGGAAGGGMAGGGMGGMAPMMGAGQGTGSGDKKRHPQLSQDEELYTEDRPWTEAVIGNRVRRRNGPDDTKKESQ